MCEGIATELEGIDLGDKRLNKRSQSIIEALAADPAAQLAGESSKCVLTDCRASAHPRCPRPALSSIAPRRSSSSGRKDICSAE